MRQRSSGPCENGWYQCEQLGCVQDRTRIYQGKCEQYPLPGDHAWKPLEDEPYKNGTRVMICLRCREVGFELNGQSNPVHGANATP